ncbi:ycf3-interacting protein 1, chloroplastic-like isoform X2 [Actinidia eriantha]|uniref:ycf3-interacting protein 1, chloroplastic-like isoform X2 n=1 Tax=Actinidia eriantha TaxID=165200 RepID=UPI002586ADD2|nr:ycf3-interacting protein 1, chloroplastic-like isoform X2 [Actinidia eriantha]
MMALHLFQQPLSSGSIASISSSTSSLSSLQTPSVHNCVQLLPPALSLHLHRHCQNRRRRRITGLVFVGKEETQLRVVSTESDDDDPNPQHLEYVFQIKRVLELLRTNRDMIFSEVHEGKVPKNRVALRTLAEEMAQWPNLEVEVPKKKRGKSLYAKATDTGINPEVAAKRLNIDWDTAANIEDSGVTDDTEVPSAVGYGALYLVTAFPVIIGISVVLILFYNSLQ